MQFLWISELLKNIKQNNLVEILFQYVINHYTYVIINLS